MQFQFSITNLNTSPSYYRTCQYIN